MLPDYEYGYPGGPYISPKTLETSCYASLCPCWWDQSFGFSNYSAGAGTEFELDLWGGCTFAWPNSCVDGLGLSTNRNLKRSDEDFAGFREAWSSTFIQNFKDGDVTAYVDTNANSSDNPVSLNRLVESSPGYGDYPSNSLLGALLAYNTIYDLVNVPSGGL